MLKKVFLGTVMSTLISTPVLADTLFGEKPTLKDVVKISTLLDHPEKYLGKVIKIQGIAMNVCPKRGCWMKIKSDRKKESLLIKVNDGEMVFPMSARGKKTVIQGKLIKKMMPLKQVIELEKARHKKMKKPFDPKSVKGPRAKYMFKPIGVLIKDKK